MLCIVLAACSTNVALQGAQIDSREFVDCLNVPIASCKPLSAALAVRVLTTGTHCWLGSSPEYARSIRIKIEFAKRPLSIVNQDAPPRTVTVKVMY